GRLVAGGEGLGALVLVLDHVEDIGRVLRGAAAGARGTGLRGLRALAGATRLLRAGSALLGHALLEGLVAGVAERLVIPLGLRGLRLLLAGAATGAGCGLGRGLLLVHGRVDAARAQAEGDALLVLLLAAADHHVVHAAQAGGDRLDRRRGEHEDAEGDQGGVDDHDGQRRQQRLERRGREIAEHAAAAGEGVDAVGRGG